MSALDERAIGLASSHTVSFGTDSNSLAGSGCLLANSPYNKEGCLSLLPRIAQRLSSGSRGEADWLDTPAFQT